MKYLLYRLQLHVPCRIMEGQLTCLCYCLYLIHFTFVPYTCFRRTYWLIQQFPSKSFFWANVDPLALVLHIAYPNLSTWLLKDRLLIPTSCHIHILEYGCMERHVTHPNLLENSFYQFQYLYYSPKVQIQKIIELHEVTDRYDFNFALWQREDMWVLQKICWFRIKGKCFKLHKT